MMKYALSFAIVIATLLTVGCDKSSDTSGQDRRVTPPVPQAERTVTEEQVIRVLASKDVGSSIRLLNDVKASRYSGQLAPFLNRLWKGDHPDEIDGDFLASPRIRIELADCLAQMERNGETGLQRIAYADYARQMIGASDPDVARQAILVLGIAGTAKDVALLEHVLIEGDAGRFRAAAIALSDMSAMSELEIQRIAARVIDPERKNFLLQTWEKMKAIRPKEKGAK